MRRVLSPLGVQTSFRPNTTLQYLLVKVKNRIIDQDRAVLCTEYMLSIVCPWDKTGSRQQQRVQEHKCLVRQGDTSLSALAEHTWKDYYPIDCTILDGHPHLQQRLILEAIHIGTHPNLLNRELEDGILLSCLFKAAYS